MCKNSDGGFFSVFIFWNWKGRAAAVSESSALPSVESIESFSVVIVVVFFCDSLKSIM